MKNDMLTDSTTACAEDASMSTAAELMAIPLHFDWRVASAGLAEVAGNLSTSVKSDDSYALSAKAHHAQAFHALLKTAAESEHTSEDVCLEAFIRLAASFLLTSDSSTIQSAQVESVEGQQFYDIRPIKAVAHYCGSVLPVVIEVCERVAKEESSDGTFPDYVVTEKLATVFGPLLVQAPHCTAFVVRAFSNLPSIYTRITLAGSRTTGRPVSGGVTKITSTQTEVAKVLAAALQLLSFQATVFGKLWDWVPLLNLVGMDNSQIQFAVMECISLHHGFTDSQRSRFFERLLNSSPDEQALRIVSSVSSSSKVQQLFWHKERGPVSGDVSKNAVRLIPGSSAVDICGVLLPRLRKRDQVTMDDVSFILTDTASQNLKELALCVSRRKPALVQGDMGVGKTAVIDELARVTNREHGEELIRVHLGNEADASSLLGSYVCLDTPGEFAWVAGPLTRAVTDGLWIVIEDIDLAPLDVVSSLISLLQSRQLFIPTQGDALPAHADFQLFATRSRRADRDFSPNAMLLGDLWHAVEIRAQLASELQRIVADRFPVLADAAERFVFTFTTLRQHMSGRAEQTRTERSSNEESQLPLALTSDRTVSMRDLMKWCGRCEKFVSGELGSPNVHESIFIEAVDCFLGALSKYDRSFRSVESAHGHRRNRVRTALVQLIAAVWGVPPERTSHFDLRYRPRVDESVRTFTVGRVTVPRERATRMISSRPFAMTSHALRLLESVAVSVLRNEPVLLVGETGTGKTTVVQQLAELLNRPLSVVNLSQQTETSDLLGGFKPVNWKIICTPLRAEFDELFRRTFSRTKNEAFVADVFAAFDRSDWKRFLSACERASKMAHARAVHSNVNSTSAGDKHNDIGLTDLQRRKRSANRDLADKRRAKRAVTCDLTKRWQQLGERASKLSAAARSSNSRLAFAFIEGVLVQALRRGHWILLDEINLASTETLEALNDLIAGGSVTLTERGEKHPVQRHPDFRLFACMNPATDVGKRDLLPGIRNRFTELFVDETQDADDLRTITETYFSCLGAGLAPSSDVTERVVDFFTNARRRAENDLSDGSGHRPIFSLRTLCRALGYVSSTAAKLGFVRALFEGFAMSFLTQLDGASIVKMEDLIMSRLLPQTNLKSLLNSAPLGPAANVVTVGRFQLAVGRLPLRERPEYILTPSVERNLMQLARAVLSGRSPVLLQGPTSCGKTSLIEYLANITGHRFVRINNHEHTDLQEYVGMYVTSKDGSLTFQEGVLVDAMRRGDWIVLDELNLAPSDVLEALNRLLDDNRELLIAETGEVVQPHPSFQLFATQNPPGLYGGRKQLSRAFRNRFVELHFDDIPEAELRTILEKRCELPASFSQRVVAVMKDLGRQRQSAQVFAGKHGFITLRDLFRWADRKPRSLAELAATGYMLLAERLRRPHERTVVREILELHTKTSIDLNDLYACETLPEYIAATGQVELRQESHIAWTPSMRRLFSLLVHCMRSSEPVLLVGDTGSGKTTVCQLYSDLSRTRLHSVNCHQHTDTSDFLGGLRPVRGRSVVAQRVVVEIAKVICSQELEQEKYICDHSVDQAFSQYEVWCSKNVNSVNCDVDRNIRQLYAETRALFKWYDGPLVEAMSLGEHFLIDEISLADDAVLERLNSVLETSRTLVLAEKGGSDVEHIVASPNFRIIATMNPGGDFGKRELSPAMRNRFTEIWVPAWSDSSELSQVVEHRLTYDARWVEASSRLYRSSVSQAMTTFIFDFLRLVNVRKADGAVSLRDVLAWVDFLNSTRPVLSRRDSFIEGCRMVFIDALGVGSSFSSSVEVREACLERAHHLAATIFTPEGVEVETFPSPAPDMSFGPYSVPIGRVTPFSTEFAFSAPTTLQNCIRVARALQLRKAILLEGSPGVGKTSLVTALGAASGNHVVRINMSEQTDLMDLLGADLPVAGGSPGQFEWNDGVFLRAMQAGDWVLLDELNLAPQTVLEGLNACLDHRAEVFIPELQRTFACAPGFRIFACQNPLAQGSGRKGLPQSFLNRFTRVHLDELSHQDHLAIATKSFSSLPIDVDRLIVFNRAVQLNTDQRQFGVVGSPWEFNLRDVFRLCSVVEKYGSESLFHAVRLLYAMRMRTHYDRLQIDTLAKDILQLSSSARFNVGLISATPSTVALGSTLVPRSDNWSHCTRSNGNNILLLRCLREPLEALLLCVEMGWMGIVVGNRGCGKSELVRTAARLTGNHLHEFSMHTGIDATEFLGGFEQVDGNRYARHFVTALRLAVHEECSNRLSIGDTRAVQVLQNAFRSIEAHLLLCLEGHPAQALLDGDAPALIASVFDLLSGSTRRNLSEVYSAIVAAQSSGGCFEWIDGMLLNAAQRGEWIVIDNANLCSPTVLDRLNPLLERGTGALLVNEQGLLPNGELRVITPHANFRIFLVMNPANGQISRAMRNRGVEVALLERQGTDFALGLDSLHAEFAAADLDAYDLVNARLTASIPRAVARVCVAIFAEFHKRIDSKDSSLTIRPSFRSLAFFAEHASSLVQRGFAPMVSVMTALDEAFVSFLPYVRQRHFARLLLSHFHCAISNAFDQHAAMIHIPRSLAVHSLCYDASASIHSWMLDSALACIQDPHPITGDVGSLVAVQVIMESSPLSRSALSVRLKMVEAILTRSSRPLERPGMWHDIFINQLDSTLGFVDTVPAELQHLPLSPSVMAAQWARARFVERQGDASQSDLDAVERAAARFMNLFCACVMREVDVGLLQHQIETGTQTSFLMLSFCAHNERASLSGSLRDRVLIALLYPLLDEIARAAVAIFASEDSSTFSLVQELLRIRRGVWRLASMIEPQLHIDSHISFLVRNLRRLLGNVEQSNMFVRLEGLVRKASDALSTEDWPWDQVDIPARVRSRLFAIEPIHSLDIVRIRQRLQVLALDFSLLESHFVNGTVFSSDRADVRRQIVDSLASLAFANDTDRDSGDLISQLTRVSSSLTWPPSRVESFPERVDTDTLNLGSCLIFALSLEAILAEHSLLSRVAAVTDSMTVQEQSELAHACSTFLTQSIFMDPAPPSLLTTWRRLQWQLEASTFPEDGGIFRRALGEGLISISERMMRCSRLSQPNKPDRICGLLDSALLPITTVVTGGENNCPTLAGLRSRRSQLKILRDCYQRVRSDSVSAGLIAVAKALFWNSLRAALLSCKCESRELTDVSEVCISLSEAGLESSVISAIDAAYKSLKACDEAHGMIPSLLAAGTALVSVGDMIMRCVVPRTLVDPLVKKDLAVSCLQATRHDAEAELSFRRKLQCFLTGEGDDTLVRSLVEIVSNTASAEQHARRKTAVRPVSGSTKGFMALAVRIRSSFKDLFDKSRMSHLLDGIRNSCVASYDVDTQSLLMRESLWQDESWNELSAIKEDFGDFFEDVISPYAAGAHLAKIGVKLSASVLSLPSQWRDTTSVDGNFALDSVFEDARNLLTFPRTSPLRSVLKRRMTGDMQLCLKIASSHSRWHRSRFGAAFSDLMKSTMLQVALHLQLASNNDVLTPRHHANAGNVGWCLELLRDLTERFVSNIEHQASKAHEKAEEETTFRMRTSTLADVEATTADLDEAELRLLFPDFESMFIDTLSEMSDDVSESGCGVEKDLSPAEIFDIYHLFEVLFSLLRRPNDGEIVSALKDRVIALQMSFRAAEGLVATLTPVGGLLDAVAAGAGITMVAQMQSWLSSRDGISHLATTCFLPSRVRSIYSQSSPPEVALVTEPLLALDKRLSILLAEWPEHPVLLYLHSLIDKLLSLPASAPVMQLATGVELLLSRALDWEEYAAQHVSLAAEMGPLRELLVRWRKMEAESWPSLLEQATQEFQERAAAKWWPYLYRITVGSSSLVNDDEDANYVHNVLGSVDSFMKASLLGDFSVRLRLLRSMRDQCFLQCALNDLHGQSAERSQLLGNVFEQLHAHFAVFTENAATELESKVQPLRAKLQEFVKLASWDSRGRDAGEQLHRLKEKIIKSHRQLGRLAKQHKQMLSLPVACFSTGLSDEPIFEVPPRFANKPAFNLDDLIQRMQIPRRIATSQVEYSTAIRVSQRFWRVVDRHVLPPAWMAIVDTATRSIDDTATTIIERADELAREPDLELQDHDQSKDLLKQKRRRARGHSKRTKKLALTTLLKHLSSEAGMVGRRTKSSRLIARAEYLFTLPPLQQLPTLPLDATWTPILALLDTCTKAVSSSIVYNDRNIHWLAQFRAASASPHHDLDTSEVRRMHAFVEDGMKILVLLRKPMRVFSDSFAELVAAASCLNDMVACISDNNSSSSVLPICSQPEIGAWLSSHFATTSHLLEVLQEVQVVTDGIDQPDSSDRVAGLESLLRSLNSHHMVVSDLVRQSEGHRLVTLTDLCSLADSTDSISVIISSHLAGLPPGMVGCLHDAAYEFDSSITLCRESIIVRVRDSGPAGASLRASEHVRSGLATAVTAIQLRLQAAKQLQLSASSTAVGPGGDIASFDAIRGGNAATFACHISELLNAVCGREDPRRSVATAVKILFDEAHMLNFLDSSALQSLVQTWMVPLADVVRAYVTLSLIIFHDASLVFRHIQKLEYVLLRVFTRLLSRGFCTSLEDSDDEQEGSEPDDAVSAGGKGLGDGTGDRDRTETIEDEQELDTLQEHGDDKHDRQGNDGPEEVDPETGFEMKNNDLDDAERENVVPDKPDSDASSQESEQSEPDDRMGEGDPEHEKLVDEDLWNSSDEEKAPQSDPLERDAPLQGDGASEMVAKSDHEEEQKNDSPNEKNTRDMSLGDSADDSEERSGETDNDEFDDPDKQQQPASQPAVRDDLGESGGESDSASENLIDSEDDPMSDAQEHEHAFEDPLNVQDEEGIPDDDAPESELDAENEENEHRPPMNDEPSSDVSEEHDLDDQVGQNEPEEHPRDPALQSQVQAEVAGSDAQDQGNEFGGMAAQSGTADNEALQESRNPAVDASLTPPDAESGQNSSATHREEAGDGTFSKEKHTDHDQAPSQTIREKANPYRDLAEAVEEWKTRVQLLEMHDADTEETTNDVDHDHDASVFRYVNDEQQDALALGPKREDDPDSIMPPKSNNDSDEEELKQDAKERPADISMSDVEDEASEHRAAAKKTSNELQHKESLDESDDDHPSKPLVADEDNEPQASSEIEGLDVVSRVDLDCIVREEELEAQRLEEVRKELEERLLAQSEDTFVGLDEAQERWQNYCALTDDLCRDLTERLRLLLEPTLATKLRGDFKTGKRLNMRKIIPFVASEFKKDKIWMRRTHPTQRDYHVLIAVDDSKSMAANHAGQMACEALCVITRALAQLEVGQVSVLRFGETADVVHSFEDSAGLGSFVHGDAGAEVLRRFTFSQDRTNIQALTEACVSLLARARQVSSSGGGTCRQLAFIVSDGRFGEQSRLAPWVREAMSQNVFLVSVIIDSPSAHSSILDLQQVSYPQGKLCVTKAIDDFPFPFYVVLKDIRALPDVLSDTLSQWFELAQNKL